MKNRIETEGCRAIHSSGASSRIVAAALLIVGLLAAPLDGLAQIPFIIEGNVPDGGATAFPDPFGGADELGAVNGSDTKIGVIHTAPLPMLEFTNPNGQVDFKQVWLDTAIADDGDIWLYFAWERDSTKGSGVITYELQQDPAPAACDYTGIDQVLPEDPAETTLITSCNPWANRAAGDFLIVWDQQGQSINVILRTFDGIQFDVGTTLDALVSAAALSDDSSRGEAAINLSQTVFPTDPTSCLSIANIIPGTVTGNSDNADYKDTVLADFASAITISNCGSVRVEKVTDPAGETGTFPYTLSQADGGAINFDGDTFFSHDLVDDGDFNIILDLLPDTDYQLTEDLSGLPQWALKDPGGIVCNGQDVTEATFPVFAGDETTCVITNELQAPPNAEATLTKTVVNDNGGLAMAGDFPLRAVLTMESDSACVGGNENPFPIMPPDGIPSPANQTSGSVYGWLSASTDNFVCQYELQEDERVDYTPSDWTCSVGDVTKVDGTTLLTLDEADLTDPAGIICAITNDDIAPSLTLVKTVTNDNGGTAVATDFTLSAAGPTPISGAGGATSDATFSAGRYDLAETDVVGYAAGNWVCTGDGTQDGASVSLALAESATCAIDNDDIAPSLTLVKTVTNDNGGTAVATDFTLSAAGPTPISGAGGATSDATFSAGRYDLAETDVVGYAAGNWVCTGDGTQDGASVSLALAESATCAIDNDDIAPSLTLVKTVTNDNGGTAVATDFTLSAAGPTPISGAGGATSDATFSAGRYDLAETDVAGYAAGNWVCTGDGTQDGASVSLALAESATCAIDNDDIAPSLTLVKTVTNDNGGTAVATDFTLSAAGPTPISGAGGATSDATFSAGRYDLAETDVVGYAAGNWVCTGDGTQDGASVSLALAESATCAIDNDDIAPSLTLVKTVTNDNGGTAVATDFTLSAAGPTPISGAGGATSDATFSAGRYDLAETDVVGYAAGNWVCTGDGTQDGASVSLALAESATCAIDNDDIAPSLTLVKTVTNDNGGTAVATDFTLSAAGPTPISGAGGATSDATFSAGRYDLAETDVAGYAAGNWVCTGDGTQDGASVSLALAESATCAIDNDDIAPSLTLVKTVTNDNGGTAVATDFTLSAAGPTPISGAGGATSDATFSAGRYDLAETDVVGYAAGNWVCTGDGTQDGASVSLALAESATCAIDNDDIAPSLTLVKTVTNDNGGTAVATDFTLSAAGPTPISGAGGATSDATFSAGRYDLAETDVAGYAAGNWVCTGDGTQDGASVSLALAESATCAIDNDDIAPSLTLVKTVTNDNGGTAVATDFTLSAAGPTPISGAGGATSDATFSAGRYDLAETDVVGYAAGNWVCTGDGTQDGASVSLALAESATCAIDNDDIAPSLTLVKTVTNDNGGTAVATDFTLSAAGPTPISGAGGATSDATFSAGRYDLAETDVAGYAAGNWVCTGDGTQDGASVSLALAESATCAIDNDDIAPSLTLVKTVTNDNGGTAVATDFTLSAAGPTPISGAGGATSDATFSAGRYDLAETDVVGYAAGNWVCTGDGTQDGASVSLALAESATCAIDNDDIAPSLTLVKTVTNDNGGTAVATDFTLSAAGPTPISGAGGATSDATFSAGRYDLAETDVAGYAAGNWVCTGDGTQDGASVSLALAESATCAIDNDDIAPSLTLVKTVTNDNGGTAVATDFTLSAAGPTPISGAGGATSDATFSAGRYDLAETDVAGYAAGNWVCTGDGTQDGASVSLALAESATCAIDNDDIAPSLTLVKTVTNDNGGTAVATDFTLSAAGPTPISGAGGATSDATFSAGRYDLAETDVAGYAAGNWVCTGDGTQDGASVSLALAESATCAIDNDDIAPSLTLVKTVTNDNGGTAVATDFTLSAAGPTPISGAGGATSDATFSAGRYDLAETDVAGYAAGNWVCTGDGTQDGASVSLALAESATCAIDNDDIAPSLIIAKTPDDLVINPGDTATFTIEVTNVGGGPARGVVLDDVLPSPDDSLTPLVWSTSTSGCSVDADGVTLQCTIGELPLDPTPGTIDGDETSFEAVVLATIPADYLAPSPTPGGPGDLGSNFESDGNLVVDGTETFDWECGVPSGSCALAAFTKVEDLPSGRGDDSFGQGSKENTPVPAVVDGSIPKNKSDLLVFLLNGEVVDGNVFLELGWLRSNILGTANFDFELNRSTVLSSNGVTPVRTVGDLLIKFDFASGGKRVELGAREWNGSAWVNPDDGTNSAIDLDSFGLALGAVNDPDSFGTLPGGVLNPFTGELLLDNTFGEAVVNLTQLFGDDCRSFASAYVKSRSSDSFTSALKDFIAPIPVDIDTCRTIPLPNTATVSAGNHGGVSDTGSISVTNDPDAEGP